MPARGVAAPVFALLLVFCGVQNMALASDVPNPRTVEVGPPLRCDLIESIVAAPQDFFIIDARSPSEYDEKHVDTAVNVPYDSLEYFGDALPADKDANIITYCRSGGRATVLKALLHDLGYTRINVVPGSQMDRADKTRLSFRCGDPG